MSDDKWTFKFTFYNSWGQLFKLDEPGLWKSFVFLDFNIHYVPRQFYSVEAGLLGFGMYFNADKIFSEEIINEI